MTHTLTRRRVVAALAGLPLVGLSLARRMAAGTAETARAAPALMPKPKPTPTSTPTPTPPNLDFNLFMWDSQFPGYLVRDGSVGPIYETNSFGYCVPQTALIWIDPMGDDDITVTLELLNLPEGVTSQTATSVFVPAGEMGWAEFELVAASDAPSANATVTVRAMSGPHVHTVDAQEFSIVDELPPLCE